MGPEAGQFHNGALSSVEPGPWGGHQVSGHRASQCVKSCFIINCQLLPPLTSGHWVQKWVGSTLGPYPVYNPGPGADTRCPTMEPMCQVDPASRNGPVPHKCSNQCGTWPRGGHQVSGSSFFASRPTQLSLCVGFSSPSLLLGITNSGLGFS